MVKRFVWVSISLMLWAASASIVSLALIRERAIDAAQNILNAEIENTPQQLAIDFEKIRLWHEARAVFGARERSPDSEALLALEPAIKGFFKSEIDPTMTGPAKCTKCSERLQNTQDKVVQLWENTRIKLLEKNRLLHKIQELDELARQQIEIHTLVAKDFAELIGSTPLYQTKGKANLEYFKSGPFRWLPSIDDSVRSSDNPASAEIDAFREKIENLRASSKSIVEKYQEILGNIKENKGRIRTIDAESLKDKSEMAALLKSALVAETTKF